MSKIAITMGDPAGVGPELCLYLLANTDLVGGEQFQVIGSWEVLERVALELGLGLPAPEEVVDVGGIDAFEFEPGLVDANCGAAAHAYIQRAIDGALAGEFDAVVTAPINKESLSAAGISFPGHTEIFADRCGAARSCMLQVSDEVTASFVTCHCGFAEVPALITEERIIDVIELSAAAIEKIKPGRAARMVALGLNPHAGEGGLFGRGEEESIIRPALEEARKRGFEITGPVPPDTAFLPDVRQRTDCFICMYHDQGHIPLKALAFDRAVNVTLGLPIVRTSVDHGTAFDIAWKGVANPGSLVEASRLAVKLSARA
ncbi:MAG: 4-hydroxythreonine-4-phosphate dehydrogenase PdxA [Verrucomicrobiales bacterium]